MPVDQMARVPPEERLLIWCRGNGRARIARFIDGAKKELLLQNERYQDPTIVERLVAAHSRGVKVHLMSLPPHALKEKKVLEGVGKFFVACGRNRAAQEFGIVAGVEYPEDLRA